MLRGAAAAVVKNMSASLDVPTATSVRAIPAKLMIDNRIVINNHLKRTRGGKISFTHLIGYAIVQAVKKFPNMNRHFAEVDGKPNAITPAHTNLGLAIDLQGKEGARQLVVAAIKGSDAMRFGQFIAAYEDIVRRARDGKLTAEDFSGVTISLTNPGTIGTVHSVPRLMRGQGAIIGVGAMEYPAEFQGASEERIAELGIGKLITLTSTYDHRIIQGAESGDFLRTVHELLLSDDFFDEIFHELGIPYEPVRWRTDNPDSIVDKNARVIELIAAYRNRGHLMADIDPLRLDKSRFRNHPDLDVTTHGMTLWDLDRVFKVNGFAGAEHKKLRDVLGLLRDSYCRHVGVEYTHILEPDQQKWLEERVEVKHEKPTVAQQKYVLSKLNAAEAFETFLQTKYVGQKRFSLEGAETVIPMMDAVIDQAAEHALDEVVIGMPHRGRLNVLANIVGKPYSQIFSEFEGNLNPSQAHGSGDVKYHLGANGTYLQMFGDNDIAVSLVANPSHLEAVDPVLEGIVRAKQDLLDKGDGPDGFTVVPLMLHGDAAFAGQGVVAETLNLALLRGYRTGGTIHIVVNNQIGFTTSPSDAKSSEYCTDVAKMIGAPIFHVNGDDPEAAVWVARLAMDFRQKFKKDVIIDMLCYRRRGHNEGDDPSMTQPAMYDAIDTKRGVRKTYTESLIGRGDISMKEAEDALRDYQGQLEQVFNEVRELEKHEIEPSESVESDQMLPAGMNTAVDKSLLAQIGDAHLAVPDGFTVHSRVKPVLEKRREMAYEGKVDWAFARTAGAGLADRRGQADPAVRPGHQARHLHPAALGGHRPQDRCRVHPASAAGHQLRRPTDRRQVDGLRLGAVRIRRGGLRIRLLGGQPRRSGVVGGAVRRLRQRRAVDHRRVHLLRRGQVGSAVRRRAAAAARPRGPGSRPHLGPHRAVPAAVGRGLDDDRGAVDACELLPPAAAARAGRHPPPADRVHAEVDAAQQGRGQRHPRLHRAEVPFGDGGADLHRRRRRPRQGQADPDDQRQDLLRAGGAQGQGQARGRGDRADRAARAAAKAAAQRDAGPLSQRRAVLLGAGGACQPGRMADVRPDAARAAAREVDGAQADIPARDVGAVVGLVEGARGRAAGDHRRGVRLNSVETPSTRLPSVRSAEKLKP